MNDPHYGRHGRQEPARALIVLIHLHHTHHNEKVSHGIKALHHHPLSRDEAVSQGIEMPVIDQESHDTLLT